MRVRHQARVAALQALFEVDCTGHHPAEVIERRLLELELPETGMAFARQLVLGIDGHLSELDDMIATYAPEWPVDQIAIIDRNVLRIAVYELLMHPDTPTKVAINEAVELAKEFGSESAGRFVNGVLGSLVAKEAAANRP
jgi:N utilization substance protein B